MKEEYLKIDGIWHYKLYNECDEEMTNSFSLPGFANKSDAKESAFGWMVQNGYVYR